MLPLVSVRFNFGTNPVELRIRVALFLLAQVSERRRDHLAFGMRFETAEGHNGMHNYPHMQLITEFGSARIETPQWLPQTQPALPLDVVQPAGLVIAMLVSLYGSKFTRQLQLIGTGLTSQLKGYLAGSRYLQKLPGSDTTSETDG